MSRTTTQTEEPQNIYNFPNVQSFTFTQPQQQQQATTAETINKYLLLNRILNPQKLYNINFEELKEQKKRDDKRAYMKIVSEIENANNEAINDLLNLKKERYDNIMFMNSKKNIL